MNSKRTRRDARSGDPRRRAKAGQTEKLARLGCMTLVGHGRVCGRPAEGLISMAVYGLDAQDREAATACAQHLQALQHQCAADGIAYRVMARDGHPTGEHW